MDAPTASVGYPAALLHIKMRHLPGPLDDDPLWLPIYLAVRVYELPPAQAQLGKNSGDGAPADEVAGLLELQGDAGGRPLVLAPHCLDLLDESAGCGRRLSSRN